MKNTIRLAFCAAVTLVAACAEPATSTFRQETYRAGASSGPTLVECPTDVTKSISSEISPLGGEVSLDGTTITLPAGAVLLPTTITLTIPASKYMEVDIRANGAEHFTFEVPVTVALGYARCSRTNIDKGQLSAWYINSATKALLQNMGGADDKVARKVTFKTDHLSGYAIAN